MSSNASPWTYDRDTGRQYYHWQDGDGRTWLQYSDESEPRIAAYPQPRVDDQKYEKARTQKERQYYDSGGHGSRYPSNADQLSRGHGDTTYSDSSGSVGQTQTRKLGSPNSLPDEVNRLTVEEYNDSYEERHQSRTLEAGDQYQTFPSIGLIKQPSVYDTPSQTKYLQPANYFDNSRQVPYQDRGRLIDPSSRRHIAGPGPELDKSYRVRNTDSKTFFKVGRVFSTLWTEGTSARETDPDGTFLSNITIVAYKEKVHSKIRRFVVVREGDRCCSCLPVTTYDGRGYNKKGINLTEHGQIYAKSPPKAISGIARAPLRIKLSPGGRLDERLSLVHYGKVYTVETNVKVKDIGDLDLESRKLLRRYWKEVFVGQEEIEDVVDPFLGTSDVQAGFLSGVGAASSYRDGMPYSSYAGDINTRNTHPTDIGTQSMHWDSTPAPQNSFEGGQHLEQSGSFSYDCADRHSAAKVGNKQQSLDSDTDILPSQYNDNEVVVEEDEECVEQDIILPPVQQILQEETNKRRRGRAASGKHKHGMHHRPRNLDDDHEDNYAIAGPHKLITKSTDEKPSRIESYPLEVEWAHSNPALETRGENVENTIPLAPRTPSPSEKNRTKGGVTTNPFKPLHEDQPSQALATTDNIEAEFDGFNLSSCHGAQEGHRRTMSFVSLSSVSDVENDLWSLASASTISSLEDQPGWQDRLITLMSRDSQLQKLFIAALKKMSPERFQENLKRGIKKLSIDLRLEAQTLVERKAAKVIARISSNTAYQIRQKVEMSIDSAPETRIVSCLLEEKDESGPDFEVDDGVSENAEDLEPPTDEVESFISNSHAFEIMKESFRLFVYPDTARGALFKTWPPNATWVTRHSINYKFSWNGPSLLKNHFRDGQRLGELITLTGNIFDAQATSCKDYLCSTWPEVGELLLDGLENFILDFHDVIIEKEIAELRLTRAGSKIANTEETAISITLRAPYEVQIIAARALSWVCSAIRSSPYAGLSVSSADIEVRTEKNTLYIIQGELEEISVQRSCWHNLFPNSVIAIGFPIRQRSEGHGLELSFADMALASKSMSLVEYDNGLILAGLNSVIIPVAELAKDDALQWHCEYKVRKGSRKATRISQILRSCNILSWHHESQPRQLIQRRCFLGWVEEAHILIGTKGFSNTRPQWSGAKPGKRVRYVKSHNLTFGTGGMGWITAQGSMEWSPTSVMSQIMSPVTKDVFDTLTTGVDELIIVYDNAAKISWLIPKVSFVLFVLHATVSSRNYNIWDGKKRVTLDLADSGVDGCERAWKTLERISSYTIQKSDTEINSKSTISKTIEDIWHTLDIVGTGLEDAQTALEIVGEKAPRYIHGVEFNDVLKMTRSMKVKRIRVDQAWANLTHDQPTVVLCRGFEQPIVPTSPGALCEPWKSVPQGENYLVALGGSLIKLLEEQENEEGTQLGEKLKWCYDSVLVQNHHQRSGKATVAHAQQLKMTGSFRPDQNIRRKLEGFENACFVFADKISTCAEKVLIKNASDPGPLTNPPSEITGSASDTSEGTTGSFGIDDFRDDSLTSQQSTVSQLNLNGLQTSIMSQIPSASTTTNESQDSHAGSSKVSEVVKVKSSVAARCLKRAAKFCSSRKSGASDV